MEVLRLGDFYARGRMLTREILRNPSPSPPSPRQHGGTIRVRFSAFALQRVGIGVASRQHRWGKGESSHITITSEAEDIDNDTNRFPIQRRTALSGWPAERPTIREIARLSGREHCGMYYIAV